MQRSIMVFLLMSILFIFASCSSPNSSRAILWTDRPEFAFYAEFFNAAQDKYKVEVRFFEAPAYRLIEGGEYPDIVAASWLKNSSTRVMFRPFDGMLSRGVLDRSSFYPRLLSMGRIDKRQYLLPVSFNIPAVIFAKDASITLSNPFTIEMREIKEQAKTFNRTSGAVYSRIGFSPSAKDEFLFLAATLFGASFREASPIAWDAAALGQSISWIQQWISEANTDIQMEEDFVFKHYHNPPDRLISSGRTLYTYIDSADYFTLPEVRRMNLDFRWIAEKETIPLDERVISYGIHKKTKSRKAAVEFTRWFFNDETQRLLLEEMKNKRINEVSFGIAGGFSAMQTVTEQIFPQFYPDLIGHIPPENYLLPPNVLPRNWMVIKERVILPYLRERIRHTGTEDIRPLDRRINDWYRLNRE